MRNALLPDLCGEQRTETVPPQTHRVVADIDTAFDQHVVDLAQRQWIADVHHHHEAHYLGRTVDITERIVHHRRLRNLPFRLKTIYADNAPFGHPRPLQVMSNAAFRITGKYRYSMVTCLTVRPVWIRHHRLKIITPNVIGPRPPSPQLGSGRRCLPRSNRAEEIKWCVQAFPNSSYS